MNIATIEIAEVPTVVEEARMTATILKGVARAFTTDKARAADRPIADAAAAGCFTLAARLKGYAAALLALRHRKIEGYVVGYTDPCGVKWFIHHAWNYGNVMRCLDVESAYLRPDIEAVREWARDIRRSHGEDEKGRPWPAPAEQLAGREVRAWPVNVTLGPAILLPELGREMG